MLSELFAPVIEVVNGLILQFNYLGIAFVSFLENIIAPIPSEFVFPWAGFLASQGKLNIFLIALAGAIGSTLAGLVLYFLGSKFNGPKTREFVDKYGKFLFIKLEDLQKAEKWFEKYGIWTVLIFRFIPLGRSLISIPAGFVKMNVWVFATLTFVGTFFWSFVLTYAGYLLGENWEVVSVIIKKYEKVAIVLIAIAGVGFFVWKAVGYFKSKNQSDPKGSTDVKEADEK